MKRSWPTIVICLGTILLLMFACGRMATAQTTPLIKSITLEQAVNFCAKAYADFKNKGSYFDRGMKILDPSLHKSVALVCVGYGSGFEDGQKGNLA